jgi:hypothetical protein
VTNASAQHLHSMTSRARVDIGGKPRASCGRLTWPHEQCLGTEVVPKESTSPPPRDTRAPSSIGCRGGSDIM